jgi:hypothetical protein
MTTSTSSPWPELTDWSETREALHLWTQIVGKVRLTLVPFTNQWWNVTLYVSARGLTTSLMHAGARALELEFNFLDDVLALRTTEGELRTVALESRSVASFYDETMSHLADIGVPVRIFDRPNEVPVAIPFGEDTRPREYDADAARRYWHAMCETHRVMSAFRSRYAGKVSPVHYFWGAADLAVTRFSGRTAPLHQGVVPNCPDVVQQLAYNHELSSCGFWAGENGEGQYYAYAYPEPLGFAEWPVAPEGAYYDNQLGEFVLPYSVVRQDADPDSALMSFFESTYQATAELADWDRAALELAKH